MPTVRFALSLALFAVPLSASAQNEIKARAATITVGGRLHTQYSSSSVSGADDDFFFRRARISLDILINDFLDGKIEPDFAGGRALLQDTFFRLTFAPEARVSIGIFKRAFSTFDISSSTDLPTIERTGVIEANVPRRRRHLQFQPDRAGAPAGRRHGASLEGLGGSLHGHGHQWTGNNVPDVNDAKSPRGAGIDYGPRAALRFAAAHDQPTTTARPVLQRRGSQFGTWREGVHVLPARRQEELPIDDTPPFLTDDTRSSSLPRCWRRYLAMEGSRFVGFGPTCAELGRRRSQRFDDAGRW
jgi:hypothetical protein